MRIATETVWATVDGKLVPDGDPKARFLVASKGHPMPDKKLAQFGKQAEDYFKDATFDRAGSLEPHKMLKQPAPVQYARLDTPEATKADSAGIVPENREEALPKLRTRAGKKKAKTAKV